MTLSGLAPERLKSDLRVQAWLRRCTATGFMATVARKGDADAGALFIKINRLRAGCEVYSGVAAPDGSPAWMRASGPAPVPEAEADQYLARQAKYDSDMWVLEIEDPRGTFTFDEPVISA